MLQKRTANQPACWRIRVVVGLKTEDSGYLVAFSNGESAVFMPGARTAVDPLTLLHLSLKDGGPLAVLLAEDGMVLEAGMLEETRVQEIEDCPQRPDLLRIWLGGHAGAVYLSKQQPEFDTLFEQLNHSLLTGQILLLVFSGGMRAVLPGWDDTAESCSEETNKRVISEAG